MRRAITVVAICAVALAVTACAGGSGRPRTEAEPAPTRSIAPSSVAAEAQAIDLVGLWRVSDADGEGSETWLRLDADELRLWRGCELVLGSWRAGDQAFVASVWGAAGDCVSNTGAPSVGWLERAASYSRVGDSWVLRDVDGNVVAGLSIDGGPTPLASVLDVYSAPPAVDVRVREALAPPAPLPEGLQAVTAHELVGRWVPLRPASTDPHAVFLQDGTWQGSDGCNGGSGRWSVTQGQFLGTSGPSTAIGCEGAPVPGWVGSARLAGFDGGELVFLDADAQELGRLVRG